MTEDLGELTYYLDPEPEHPVFKDGVTRGWLIVHSGRSGPARAVEVAALQVDGAGVIEQTGEWQDVTIVNDQEDS